MVGRFLHWGATTQDMMDPGDALRYVRSLRLIEDRLCGLGDDLAQEEGE